MTGMRPFLTGMVLLGLLIIAGVVSSLSTRPPAIVEEAAERIVSTASSTGDIATTTVRTAPSAPVERAAPRISAIATLPWPPVGSFYIPPPLGQSSGAAAPALSLPAPATTVPPYTGSRTQNENESSRSAPASGGATDPTPSAPPATSPVETPAGTIIVDASAALSVSGGDDLARMKRIFAGAGYPESNGGLETSAPFLAGLGADTIRLINYEGGSRLDEAGNFVRSDRLGFALPWVARYGYTPHVIVGQWQPEFIAGAASSWDEAAWARYRDYATKFVRYFASGYEGTGFPTVYFEVGNEVDITQQARDLWTLANPNVGQGDPTRYEHYLRVYEVWANAVAEVARERPDRMLRIGGPAMGGQSLFLNNGDLWHRHFIEQVAARGLRLDFLSMHYYGDPVHGWAGVAGSGVRALADAMRSALAANGKAGTPILITEYGATEASDEPGGRINYDHRSAAWAAAFLTEAAAGGAGGGLMLIVRDNFGPDTNGVRTVPSLDTIVNGVEQPKPLYNAFKAFSLLPGTRRAVALPADGVDLRAVASADGARAGLLVANYGLRYESSGPVDDSVNRSVAPRFSSLPFSGDATVERYLIDERTSVGGAPLTRVEACRATAAGGILALPAETLLPSAVSLWLVSAGADANLPTCI